MFILKITINYLITISDIFITPFLKFKTFMIITSFSTLHKFSLSDVQTLLPFLLYNNKGTIEKNTLSDKILLTNFTTQPLRYIVYYTATIVI